MIEVLLVEDNELNARLALAILRGGEFRVSRAVSGEEALEKLVSFTPDLILMDLDLPGMSGFETMQAITAMPIGKDIPIIALSAFAMPHEIEKAKRFGAVHYITKPIDLDAFPKAVREFASRRRVAPKEQPNSQQFTDWVQSAEIGQRTF